MIAAHPQIDRYAVLGNPVAHSRSPAIHASFARQTGEAVAYDRLLCPLDGFARAVREFAAAGGRGCNVTVPFKFEALRLATSASARATLAGAANVLRFDTAGWWADNTDGAGLVRDIELGAGVALAGRRVLLVGAGGAAAGVLGPLLAARPAEVVVVNRSPERADALASRHAGWAHEHGVVLTSASLGAPGAGFDVLVNASASSLHGAPVPVPATALARGALAVDLMYGAPAEPFLAWAQAAEAFLVWRGVRPQTAPVLQALRAQFAVDE